MRDIALLALIKGVVPTAICFGLEPKEVEQWMHSLGNDPFFAVIRRLIWEHLQKHDVEQTALEFRMSINTIQRIRKYMQHQRDLGQPLEEPQAIESNELTGSAIALSNLTFTEIPEPLKTDDFLAEQSKKRGRPKMGVNVPRDGPTPTDAADESDELEGASDEEKPGEFIGSQNFLAGIQAKKETQRDKVYARVSKAAKMTMIEEAKKSHDMQAVAERYNVHVSTLRRWVQDTEKCPEVKSSLIRSYLGPSDELAQAYKELQNEGVQE
jgi:hypothetical protein